METKRIIIFVCMIMVLLTGCGNSRAPYVNYEISNNFDTLRRVVVYNTVNGKIDMQVEGYSTISVDDSVLLVTTIVGNGIYEQNYIRLTDDVYYAVETIPDYEIQENESMTDPYYHRVFVTRFQL